MKPTYIIISILIVIIVTMSFFMKTTSDDAALKMQGIEVEKAQLMKEFSYFQKRYDSLERITGVLTDSIRPLIKTLSQREIELQNLKKRKLTNHVKIFPTDSALDAFYRARYPKSDAIHFFDSASDRK